LIEKIRIDKWLWSIRFFKTRTMSTDACVGNKVKVNGQTVKPSFQIKPGDTVQCKKDHINFTLKAITLIAKRVGPPIAQACYEDLTPQSELDKLKEWFEGAPGPELRERGAGRPTKRERRTIDEFKSESFWCEDE